MEIATWPRCDKYIINKLEEPYDERSSILFTLIPTFRDPIFLFTLIPTFGEPIFHEIVKEHNLNVLLPQCGENLREYV